MQKILIHTVTNPNTTKKELELFFLKTLYFVKKSLSEYEISIRIDEWDALDQSNFLGYVIDDLASNMKGNCIDYLNKNIYTEHLKSQKDLKNVINEIIEENTYIDKNFKSIEVKNDYKNYNSYTGTHHFNLLGNVYHQTNKEYDYYVFKSTNAFALNNSMFYEKTKLLSKSNLPFIYDGKFITHHITENAKEFFTIGTNAMNTFIIKNKLFNKYCEMMDNSDNIEFKSGDKKIIKISEKFKFGIFDFFQMDVNQKESEKNAHIIYKKNYSDFINKSIIGYEELQSYIQNKTKVRRELESGPFFFELMLWFYMYTNSDYTKDRVEEMIPDVLFNPTYSMYIFRLAYYKQNVFLVLKSLYNFLRKNTELDLSILEKHLKIKRDVDYKIKLLINQSIDTDVSLEKHYKELATKFTDDYVLHSVRKDIITIIEQYEKNYSIQWSEGIL